MIASGVYVIENKFTCDQYVGSAINIQARWRSHKNKLNIGAHCNSKLQRAWNKYGKDGFTFNILELCAKEKLISIEQEYIDRLNPKYNICKTAGSWLGMKHSMDTIERMRIPKSEEWKNKLRGIKKSEEHKMKLSVARMGMTSPRKGVKMSEETKNKIRLSNIGRKYPNEINIKKGKKLADHFYYGKGKAVLQFDLHGVFIREFISADEAQREFGFAASNIRKYCNNGKSKIYGYIWKFKEPKLACF